MAEETATKNPQSLAVVKQQLNEIVGDKETLQQLVQTTFKGLNVDVAKQAMMEAMFRGFTLDDFLKKNVYAVKYSNTYSLITSIDYARKIGMRSGVVGVDAPEYKLDDNGDPLTCSVTVRKRDKDGYEGKFTALVFFKEYSTNQNLWKSKPMTMIAKVAEMHALRKACPEELAQAYDESEMHREVATPAQKFDEVDDVTVSDWSDQLEDSEDLESLQRSWAQVPAMVKPKLKAKLAEMKKKFEDVQTEGDQQQDSETPS